MKWLTFISLVIFFLGAGCSPKTVPAPEPTANPAIDKLQQQLSEVKSENLNKVEEFQRLQQQHQSEIQKLEDEEALLQSQVRSLEETIKTLDAETASTPAVEPETNPDKIGLKNGHTFFAEVTSLQGNDIHISIDDKTQTGQLNLVDYVDFRSSGQDH